MKNTCLLMCVGLSILCIQFALAQEKFSGMIYGEDHAFSLTEPDGWVLDNQSGVSQGLHAVFYPKGSSWQESHAVMYAKAVSRPDTDDPIQTQVDDTIEIFKNNGSPDYTGAFKKAIKTEKNITGKVYLFSGDKWGNFEAVAYFAEAKTINFIVLTCRSKSLFDSSLGAFYKAAQSYAHFSDNVLISDDSNPKQNAAPGPSQPNVFKRIELKESSMPVWRQNDPNHYLWFTADFNGDNKDDRAELRVNDAGDKIGLFVFLSDTPDEKTGRLLKLLEVPKPLARLGISLVVPGEYVTAADKGMGKGKPKPKQLVEKLNIEFPSINLFSYEGSREYYFWDRPANEFKSVWISD